MRTTKGAIDGLIILQSSAMHEKLELCDSFSRKIINSGRDKYPCQFRQSISNKDPKNIG